MVFYKFKDPAKYFPPGYAYENEWKTVKFLWIVGVGLSLQYFADLYTAVNQLYSYQNNRRVLNIYAVAPTFLELIAGHWIFYIPLFLFLILMIAFHYFYYYNNTKSIYLMRRLPSAVLLKSCAQAPVLGICITLISLIVLYFLYCGIYFMVIPKKCLP